MMRLQKRHYKQTAIKMFMERKEREETNMKKLTMMLAVGMLVLAGCGNGDTESKEGNNNDGEKKGKWTIATVAPYEPYEMINEKTNELEGFDIDLGNAIAEKLGYEIEWQNLEFDASLLAVQQGQVDMAIAGLSPEPDRLEVMDFSEVYYQDETQTTNTVVTLKDKGYQSVNDLKGKIAGVQNGTIQQSAVEGIAEEYNITVETRKEYADIVQEILNGNIDFMVCEQAMADNNTEVYSELTSFPLGVGNDSTGNAIAFKKGSALKAEIDPVIQEMKQNGEMQKLIDKWFGSAK